MSKFLEQWRGRGVYAIQGVLLLPSGVTIDIQTALDSKSGDLVYTHLLNQSRSDPPPPKLPERKGNVIPFPGPRKSPDSSMRVKDYVGKQVRVLRRITLIGGTAIEVGVVLRVSSVWHGRLTLQYATGKAAARGVQRGDVEIIRDG